MIISKEVAKVFHADRRTDRQTDMTKLLWLFAIFWRHLTRQPKLVWCFSNVIG